MGQRRPHHTTLRITIRDGLTIRDAKAFRLVHHDLLMSSALPVDHIVDMSYTTKLPTNTLAILRHFSSEFATLRRERVQFRGRTVIVFKGLRVRAMVDIMKTLLPNNPVLNEMVIVPTLDDARAYLCKAQDKAERC